MLSKLGIQSKNSAAVEVDYLNLCRENVRVVEDFADRGNLLNQRQCEDLSSKLLKITPNIRRLVSQSGAPAAIFRPALEKLYRHSEKAKALVSNCGEEDWCTAAVFQIQNENAFREILLDIGLCYNVIYEQAKSSSGGWNDFPKDLWLSSLFSPATDIDIQQDQEDVKKRLEDLANEPGSSNLSRIRTLKQCMASYLLLKLKLTSKKSQATALDSGSEICWAKEKEPPGTWGMKDRFLGAGAGANGVCKTKWMGIRCAKKHFDVVESEVTFLKEAGILAHLNHPCIVKFLCCGNEKRIGKRFIAMELMKKNLLMLIEDRRNDYFPLSIAVDMMVQMARGMCYLHDQGIAHRDLKPQNVVVNILTYPHLKDHFCVKLVDFGMSKTKVESLELITMSAFGIGTTRYKAPEVYHKAHLEEKGKTTWFKADVFSFAMTCAHVLSLKMPFGDTKVGALYDELVNEKRPELPTYCPQELVELLQACWDTNPSSRPGFIEICTRLETLQHKLLRGFSSSSQDSQVTEYNGGFGFIEAMVGKQSSIQKKFGEGTSDEVDKIELSTVDEVEDEILDSNEIEGRNVASVTLSACVGEGTSDEVDVIELSTVDEVEDGIWDSNKIEGRNVALVISCACGGSLEFLHRAPYDSGNFQCNVCYELGDKEVYHCATCYFVAHKDCAEIKDEVDYLKLCRENVRVVADFAARGNLLNQRQCEDLSSKLLKITPNIRRLVSQSGAPAVIFRPALEKLYRHSEKAKVLVSNCGEEDWCTAAVFQIQNENAFREILLDIGLCYNVIYEQAKSSSGGWNDFPEDLWLSSLFSPATDIDIQQDQEDVKKKLEDLANEPGSSNLSRTRTLKQCMASYLLSKLKLTSEKSQASGLDVGSAIFWAKEREPPGTWGMKNRFLGAGAGANGVCKTKWMGIRCVKEHFDVAESEVIFLKEAGILAHLNHPCIVKFLCCGNEKRIGKRFIAMELMKKNLLMLIEDRRNDYFSLSIVVDMMVQMARGMCYLHDQGIAHRNLKPQNVVVNTLTYPHLEDHFCVKLVDFGMSKTKVESSKLITMSGFGIGTTRYRAPEVYRKAHLEEKGKITWFKADVFSFAMTCAHVLSLKMPFGDTKVGALYDELVNEKRPELPAYCPQELVELLQACWDTNPSSRPGFIEICTRLETLQHKLLRGFSSSSQDSQALEYDGGFGFIEAMVGKQSSIQKKFGEGTSDEVDEFELSTVDEVEDGIWDSNKIEGRNVASVISCACGGSLEFLHRAPYGSGSFQCNVCYNWSDKEVYHCATCYFDAHKDCAEIKDEVNVFFHGDPLHLLVQYYYDNNPHIACGFCGESLQGSKWVYNCRDCNFNVHALCTKHARKVFGDGHSHPLSLVQSPPRKHGSCDSCNGDFKGYHYTCIRNQCTIDLHPSCFVSLRIPLCIFDPSHRIGLRHYRKRYFCGKCGGLGFSRSYRCQYCAVDIHLDCYNDMEVKEADDWNDAYDQFMLKYENKANHAKMASTIAELLEMLLINTGLETRSSLTSRPPPVVMREQPRDQSPTSSEASHSNVLDDAYLQQKIGAESEERKAKRMAVTEARRKARVELVSGQGAKLENLGRLLQDDMQSSELDAGALIGANEKLKKLQDFVHGVTTSKMRQVPQIALRLSPSYDRSAPFKLLTTLGRRHSGLTFLCEEPGHEHIVKYSRRTMMHYYFPKEVDWKRIQLFLVGLRVVRKALMKATHIIDLESVTLPILGDDPWDLRAIELEKPDLQTGLVDEAVEDVESQQGAEDAAAEWFRNDFEENNISIFEEFGLLRVRYTATEQGDCPRYKQGSVAWLCTEHQNQGVEAGVLEPCPLRIYHNLEYDQKRGFL